MDAQDNTFASLLKKHTAQANTGADRLMTQIQQRFPTIPEWKDQIDKKRCVSAINNWLYKGVEKPDEFQWSLLVAIAAVLSLKEDEAEQLLRIAGMKTLGSLQQGAAETYQELFDVWMKPVFAEEVQGSLTEMGKDLKEQGGLIKEIHKQVVPASARSEIAGELLSEAEALYRQRVALVYSHIRLPGTGSDKLALRSNVLEHIFIPPTLLFYHQYSPSYSHANFRTQPRTVNSPPKPQRRFTRQIFQQQEPIALDKAMQTNLLIIGEPGAGKSTLFRWLAITFAQGLQRQPDRLGPGADADWLPILIELGHLPLHLFRSDANKLPQWMQLLPKFITAQDPFSSIPSLLITRAIEEGRCLLLFDGFDEITDRQVRIRIIQSLANFAVLYPKNRLLIGSRPAGSDEAESLLGREMRRCHIARFTSDNMKHLFYSWYAQDTTLLPQEQRAHAESLYTYLQDTPHMLDLAKTPLLCTLLVLIWHSNNASFPTRRAMVYEECCRVLIEKWERQHDISYQGTFSRLGWRQHMRLLQALAFVIHERNQQQQHTGKYELLPILTRALLDEGCVVNEATAMREAEQFLEILSLRSGLLQYEGNDRYGFPHLTFQEFLTARYIAQQSDQEHMIDLLMTHLHEGWWREVWLLAIGYLSTQAEWEKRLSKLFSALLSVYHYPSWYWSLHMSDDVFLRIIWEGWRFLRRDLECWLAGELQRELELAVLGYLECVPGPHLARVEQLLLRKVYVFARRLLYDPSFEDHNHLLKTIYDSPLDVSSVVRLFVQSLWGHEIFLERAALNLAEATRRYPEVIPLLINILNSRPSDAPYTLVHALCQVPSNHKEVLVLLQRVFSTLKPFSNSQIRAALHLFSHGIISEDIIGCLQYGLVVADTTANLITSGLALAFLENNKTLSQIWHVFTSAPQESAMETLLQNQQYRFTDILLHLIDSDSSVLPEIFSVAQQEGIIWRVHALEALAIAASNHPEVQQLCLKLVLQREKGVWVETLIGLLQLAAENAEVCNLLLELLHDPDPSVRRMAINSLHLAASKDSEILNALAGMLQDQDAVVCFTALYGVSELAPQHPTLSTTLKELLQGKEFILNGKLLPADQSLSLWLAFMEKVGVFFPIQDTASHHLFLQILSNIDVQNTQRLIAQEHLAGAITQLIPGNEEVVGVLLKLLNRRKPLLTIDVLAELRNQCLNGLGKAATTNPLLSQKVLRSLSSELFKRRSEDSTNIHKALEQQLNGRPLPGYRWLSLRVQRRQRLFYLFVISIILLALGTLLILAVSTMLPFFLQQFVLLILFLVIILRLFVLSEYNVAIIINTVLVFIRYKVGRKRDGKLPQGS